jgi:uridine kinase
MASMQVQDDTIIISIRSQHGMAKTGKSTIARVIAEALGKVGLSVGIEDTYVKRSEGITKDLMDHCDAIGVLVDRGQSILIKVADGPAQ